MKRLLALLLCAVMLFSVLGAEAWAADGDTLTVYTKSSGGKSGYRNIAVGETFTYTYALNSEEYGVGFRKGSDLANALNEYLAEAYADGTMMAIAETYGVQAAIIAQ